MNWVTRRKFLAGMATLSAAAATRFALAAQETPHHGGVTIAAGGVDAIEKEAAEFSNPLRMPGASGLYGVMRAIDLRELHVARTEIEVLPGKRTPFLAYTTESGGKQFLNPALLARRGDEIRVRMVNQLEEPTIIHWHGIGNDADRKSVV